MSVERVYYSDHAERYKHLPPRTREDYPDEVIISDRWFRSVFKREKKLAEFTKEDFKKYGHDFRLYAKDIPLSRAIPKEFK